MARMIPDVDTTQLEHGSEEAVYRALRDQLGDDFVVLHSYPWLRPWRGEGALAEGEIDFVVLHPERGMLVLEVKGGDNIEYDGYQWTRGAGGRRREFQDPFRQAQKNMYALLDIVKQRSGGRLQRSHFSFGYAVVFPHSDYEGEPPPHADNAIILSRRQLPSMKQAIGKAFASWTEKPKPLSREQYLTLLNDCLMPRFRVLRRIGPDIDLVVNRLLELTEHQAQVFEGCYAQDRVLVEGVAGSGKTFLALQRALAFARCGKRTLYVCYNKELSSWIRREVAEDPTTAEFRDLITVSNFHALAAELAAAAGIQFRPAGGGPPTEAFWDDEAPDLLEQAVLAIEYQGGSVRYDALVVDEAQDFSLGWWYALTQSVLHNPRAPIYAFIDPHQSLRGEIQWPDIEFDTRFRLKTNCRNTRKIAAASASVLALEPLTPPRAPSGAQPRVILAESRRQQKSLVFEELRRLLQQEGVTPRQVVLLGPAAKENGSLSDVDKVGGVRLVTSAEEWRDGKGVLVTTARSFKGLEADIALLYDLDEFGRLFRRQDLYVACTRARALLVAVVHGAACRELIEAAIAAAEQHP